MQSADKKSSPVLLILLAVGAIVVLPTITQAPAPTNTFPIAPDEVNIPGKQEVHGATSAAHCKQMERTFRLQGRNLRLTKTKRNPSNLGGGVLTTLCVFEGPDAQSATFQDKRYETEAW
ncbi:hypothetical protein ACQ4M4_05225 [Leptolyngbya sp. AN02str]|uniref:hypothetical protein n=1 Tax=Leptolyngbya sp. AN02str TaxID=3423363 RepID=UPI003D318B87